MLRGWMVIAAPSLPALTERMDKMIPGGWQPMGDWKIVTMMPADMADLVGDPEIETEGYDQMVMQTMVRIGQVSHVDPQILKGLAHAR